MLRPGSSEEPVRPDGTSTASGVPSTATSTATATANPTAAPTSSDDVDAEIDQDGMVTPTELERFVLRGSDLPLGWNTLAGASTAVEQLAGPCVRAAIAPASATVRNTVSFRSGSAGPVLGATVADHLTGPAGVRAFTQQKRALAGCRTGPRLRAGTPVEGAERSASYTFTIRRQQSTATGAVVVAQVGRRTVTVLMIGETWADLTVADDAARTVVRRLG